MKLASVTILGRVFGVFTFPESAAVQPDPPEQFTGYEYKCYLCGEMLIRREEPLTDKDLEDLCDLHVCEAKVDQQFPI